MLQSRLYNGFNSLNGRAAQRPPSTMNGNELDGRLSCHCYFHGGWIRSTGNDEQWVVFHPTSAAVAQDSNLAEQRKNIWKLVQHIQSLTPQRLWPCEVGQGKVSSLYLLGIRYWIFMEACFSATRIGVRYFDWVVQKVCQYSRGRAATLTFERDLNLTEVDQNGTTAWSIRSLKAQNAMKIVKRARKTREA